MSRVRPARLFAVSLAATLALGACAGGPAATPTTGVPGNAGNAGNAGNSGGGGASCTAVKGDLPGSGATFPKQYYDISLAAYKAKAPGINVTYGGGGSGKGRTDLQNNTVAWAGTDGLIKAEDKAKFTKGEFQHIPTVSAPITLSYNLGDSVKELKLDADTIAKIFQGEIKTWNDQAIAAQNQGVTLPSDPIVVARRSDGSGTTENFTKYLVKAAPTTWKLKSGSTVDWPAGSQAGDGNSGVADIITKQKGAIGYVDLADAKAKKLTFAKVKNASGEFIEPSVEATVKALSGAEVKDDLTYDPLNAKGAGAYPISAPTWVIVYKKQDSKKKADALKCWLTFLVKDNQTSAEKLNFAKLPDGMQTKALDAINKISA